MERKSLSIDWTPLLITLAALVLRMIYLAEIAANNPYFQSEILVAEVHHQWARDIISGGGVSEVYIRAPLYPYFLAAVYRLLGIDMLYPRLIQLVVSAGLTYFIFIGGRRIFGRKGGIAAAVIWAVYGTEMFFAGELFETSLTTALIFSIYLAWCRAERNGWGWWFPAAGLLLGLSVLMKPNMGLFFPLLLVWYWWRNRKHDWGWRPGLLFAAGCLIVITPVTIRNYMVGREFTPVAAYGGLNIYLGNGPLSDGVSAILPEWVEEEGDHRWGREHHATALTALSIRKASEAVGRELTATESSRYWWGESAKFAFRHPHKFILINLKKTVLFLSGYEFGNTRDLYFSRNHSNLLSVLLWKGLIKFPLGLIIPFAGLGIYCAIKKKLPGRGTLFIFFAGAAFSTILVFVCARFRMSAAPFLAILAGGGIIEAFRALNGKKVLINLAIFIPLIALTSSSIFKLEKDVSYQEYYNLGRFHLMRRDFQRGYEAMFKSFQSNPNFIPALTELGLIYETAGRHEEASRFYEQVVIRMPDNPIALYNLGAAEGKAGRLSEAREHLRRAVEIEEGFWQAWLNLGNTYVSGGELDSAEKCYLKTLEIVPDNPDVMFNLGSFFILRGDTASALEYFHTVHSMVPDYPSLEEIINRLSGSRK